MNFIQLTQGGTEGDLRPVLVNLDHIVFVKQRRNDISDTSCNVFLITGDFVHVSQDIELMTRLLKPQDAFFDYDEEEI